MFALVVLVFVLSILQIYGFSLPQTFSMLVKIKNKSI